MFEDPRGPVGQLARGTNIYMGGSKSPWAGKFSNDAVQNMQQAKNLPQYNKPTLQSVARSVLNGN